MEALVKKTSAFEAGCCYNILLHLFYRIRACTDEI